MDISFKQNINNAERVIRVFLGILLLYMAAFDAVVLSSFWNVVIWILGITFFLEGAAGYCLIYDFFGWSTRAEAND